MELYILSSKRFWLSPVVQRLKKNKPQDKVFREQLDPLIACTVNVLCALLPFEASQTPPTLSLLSFPQRKLQDSGYRYEDYDTKDSRNDGQYRLK